MSSSEQQIEQAADPVAKKRKKQVHWKTRLKTIRYWLITHPLELIFVLLLLTAVILYVNPFPQLEIVLDKLPDGIKSLGSNLGNWVAYEGGATLSGGVFVVLAIGIVAIRGRQYAIERKSWWSNHCPNCDTQFSLQRIRRTKLDKAFALLKIPVHRYTCKNCEWRGRRINEDEL